MKKLFLFLTAALFSVGTWAATYSPVDNPATKKYGDITFLDVANTKANGKITKSGATFEGDSTLAYSLRYVGQTLAITTWYNCTDNPAGDFESSPTYSDAEINGFVAPSSSSGNIGYGGAKAHSGRIRYFYATGITSVAIISLDNGSSKYVQLKIEEVAQNGNLTAVTTIDSPEKSSSTLSLIEYTTALDPTKYYKISCTSNNSSNCKVYQIRFGKYIAPAVKYTVTYKSGEGTGSDVVDSDAKTVKTFATCGFTAPSGYEFKEWQDGSSNVVAEGATVSATMTLTAIYRLIPTKYTVTYNLNGASGDVPTETNKAKDDVFTLAAAPERSGYRFDGWLCNIDGLVKAAGASYTMTAAATTFTAQWTQLFTVQYYDGTSKLGQETVAKNGTPANYETYQTKALASFVSWYSDSELSNAVTIASAVITKDTTFYGKWNKSYAESIDFISVAGDYVAQLEAKKYAFNCSDMSKVSYDNNSNLYDKGLKIKKSGTTLTFNVAAGKAVDITTGIISGATLSVNGGAAENLTITTKSNASIKTRTYYSAGEQSFVISTTTDSYCIFKSISIHDPYVVTYDATTNGGDAISPVIFTGDSLTLPTAVKGTDSFTGWYTTADGNTKVGDAGTKFVPSKDTTLYAQFESISTDARLSAITLSTNAGTLSPAYNMEVTIYSYTMPYGSASIPTITGATANNAKAGEPEIVQQAANWGDTAIVRGVAESGDKKTYKIAMLLAPKDGACLIKVATTGGKNKTVTGYYAGEGDVNLSDSKKMDKGKYIGFTLAGTTLQAGDKINVHTTGAATTGGSHIIFYDNMTDKTELYETGEIGGTGDNIFTINASMVGQASAYVYRPNSDDVASAYKWNGYVDYIEAIRLVPQPILDSIKINGVKGEPDEFNSISMVLLKNTDLSNLTIDPFILRNAPHATTPEVVTSNEGAWVEGANTYRIMDKDGDYTDYTITLSLTGTALDNTADEAKAVKVLENGQVVIFKDGKYFNVLGIQIR